MMIAGIGLKTGAPAHDIIEAIDAALQQSALTRDKLKALATLDDKSNEQGLHTAAKKLQLSIIELSRERLEKVTSGALTYSKLSMEKKGVPSVAETAALAAAGKGAKLLGPRVKSATATCALATKLSEPNP